MNTDVLLWGIVLLPALAALSWIDFRTMRLPDVLTLPLIGAGMVQYWYFTGSVWAAILGALAGYLFFVVVEKSYRALRGSDGLGRGDAKLLAAGGAWCGWTGLPWIVLIASSSGLLIAGALMLTSRKPSGLMPFGPFLAVGIALVWAAQLRAFLI
ncbi:prepilin peptidase [Hyphomonas jannaschiana]|uniref:prepilin peptidase n=1 Tax=Hyphomonas jannaschiana TaxID=86 RepID=UPI0035C754BD